MPAQRQCPQCFKLNSEDSMFCSKCGSSFDIELHTLTLGDEKEHVSDTFTQLTTGDLFDNRYRIIEEIGRGGMGRVYKAEDTKLNITVALKLIRPKYAADPKFIERFKKETLTARSISHENVIRIHDLGETEHIKYISMEHITGRSLREIIMSTGRLSVERTVDMTRQMCEALDAAHKKGIVHLDLKPSNIMVDNSGQVHIMDFGLARAIYTADSKKDRGIAGTIKYMSPEQAKGEMVDQRSDIYSLGAIIYEMMTRKPVFQGETHKEFMAKHIKETPKPPSKYNPQIPPYLENIICRCLEKDQKKRFQNTADILRELEKHKPKTQAFGLPRILRRPVFAVIAAACVIAAAYVLYILNKPPPLPLSKGRRETLAIVYLTNNTGDDNLKYLEKSLPELMISDLLQSRHIRVMSTDKIYHVLHTLNLLGAETYSTEDLNKIASACNVDYIVSGNINGSYDNLLINTYLHDSQTMELIGTEMAKGRGGDGIFTLVDTLTREIKEDFNLSTEEIIHDIDQDVVQITTISLKALRHFVSGKVLHNQGKFEESNTEFKEAVKLDDEFANAYRMMYINYNYLGQYEEADKNLSRAQSYLNRVSERDYYLIQGVIASTYQETIDCYQKLLEIYPDDLETLGMLGSIYRHLEEWDKAKAQFETIIDIDPNQENSLVNIANISMTQGYYNEAQNLLISREEIFTDKIYYHCRLGMAYLCQREFEKALEQAKLALEAEEQGQETLEFTGHVQQIMCDFPSAEKTYRQMISCDDFITQYLGMHWSFYLDLTQRDTEGMQQAIEQGMEFSQKYSFVPGLYNFNLMQTYMHFLDNQLDKALESASRTVETALESKDPDYINFSNHFRGLIYIKMGRLEDARDTAEKLRQRIENSESTKNLRHYHHLLGEIKRSEGDQETAITEFKTAYSLLPAEHSKYDLHILYLDALASAYYEIGDYERAIQEYKKITSLTFGKLRLGDKFGRAHYMLGEIYLRDSNNKKASEHFNQFLNIWTAADPVKVKEIGIARKKLNELSVIETND